MTIPMQATLAAIGRGLDADYLPNLARPLPRELSGAVVSGFRLSKLTVDIVVAAARRTGVFEILVRVKKWISDPYRPELHYMRGPGPKWREKHAH